ncbi:hypothetical protein VQ056_25305 [Paenibacillus sp. JTLBN-2024]
MRRTLRRIDVSRRFREYQELGHKQGLLNFGFTWNVDAVEAYKIAYFVEWPLLEAYRKERLEAFDLYVDMNDPSRPALLATGDLIAAIRDVARYPMRVKPFMMPGIWGGQYIETDRGFAGGYGELRLELRADCAGKLAACHARRAGCGNSVPAGHGACPDGDHGGTQRAVVRRLFSGAIRLLGHDGRRQPLLPGSLRSSALSGNGSTSSWSSRNRITSWKNRAMPKFISV